MIRARAMLATLTAATSLAGCTMLGGYGGVSVGYGGGYYDDGYYGNPYYGDPYYGSSYYGWYDDFYYPGLGVYVYDRGGHRHGWSDKHRRHWEARRAAIRDRRELRENWSDYRRERREDRRADGREYGRDGRRDGHDGRRDGWRERGNDGRGERGERGGSWRDGRADGAASAPARPDRREGGQGGQSRRERRADAPPSPRGGSDAVRAPRPQMEARPAPQAIRPEPRQERVQSNSDSEALAPRQPE